MSWLGGARDGRLRLLVGLCRAVVRAGFIRVQIRDAVPCLTLTSVSGVAVRVSVDASGTAYVVDAPGWQFPTGDLAGAARALIAFVDSVDCAGWGADAGSSGRAGVGP